MPIRDDELRAQSDQLTRAILRELAEREAIGVMLEGEMEMDLLPPPPRSEPLFSFPQPLARLDLLQGVPLAVGLWLRGRTKRVSRSSGS